MKIIFATMCSTSLLFYNHIATLDFQFVYHSTPQVVLDMIPREQTRVNKLNYSQKPSWVENTLISQRSHVTKYLNFSFFAKSAVLANATLHQIFHLKLKV